MTKDEVHVDLPFTSATNNGVTSEAASSSGSPTSRSYRTTCR
jgi:hypothetical protein